MPCLPYTIFRKKYLRWWQFQEESLRHNQTENRQILKKWSVYFNHIGGGGVEGGQIKSCDAKICKKCLCFHHNITSFNKKISQSDTAMVIKKYEKFQLKKNIYFWPICRAKQRHGSTWPPPPQLNYGVYAISMAHYSFSQTRHDKKNGRFHIYYIKYIHIIQNSSMIYSRLFSCLSLGSMYEGSITLTFNVF